MSIIPCVFVNESLSRGEHQEGSEPRITAVYDVPLSGLLAGEDAQSNAAQQCVSLYRVEYPQQEYAELLTVFPAMDGDQLHASLNAPARVKDGFYGVYTDFKMILERTSEAREKRHSDGLGSFWDSYNLSLPAQFSVMQARNELQARPSQIATAERKIEALETVSALPLREILDIPETVEKITTMLEGEISPDIDFLARFFHPKYRDIAKEIRRRTLKQGISLDRIIAWAKTQSLEALTPYALPLMRREVEDPDDISGEEPYISGMIRQKVIKGLRNPEGTALMTNGQTLYLLQKGDAISSVSESTSGVYTVMLAGSSEALYVTLDRDGRIQPTNERDSKEAWEKRLEELRKPVKREVIIPVFRHRQTADGVEVLLQEEAPELPGSVTSDIFRRVHEQVPDAAALTEKSLSGVVGTHSLVSACSGIRDIDDYWNHIWDRERITMSEVMGKTRGEKEPDQVNGPVQGAILALAAMKRFPFYFQTFFERVSAVTA